MEELPQDDKREIVIVGRSNVGKSTLINALTNIKGLAYVGKRPGKTRAISMFDVDDKFRLVDVPGYGFAKVSSNQKRMFADMIDTYFETRKNLTYTVVLIDSRRGITKVDQEIIDYLIHFEHKFAVVGTKMDKLNQSEKHAFKVQTIEALGIEPIMYSALTKKNLDLVSDLIEGLARPGEN